MPRGLLKGLSRAAKDAVKHVDRAAASARINHEFDHERRDIDHSLSVQLNNHSQTVDTQTAAAAGIVTAIEQFISTADSAVPAEQKAFKDQLEVLRQQKLQVARGFAETLRQSKAALDGFKQALPADRAKLSPDHDTKRDAAADEKMVEELIRIGHEAYNRIKANVTTAISKAGEADDLAPKLVGIKAEVESRVAEITLAAQLAATRAKQEAEAKQEVEAKAALDAQAQADALAATQAAAATQPAVAIAAGAGDRKRGADSVIDSAASPDNTLAAETSAAPVAFSAPGSNETIAAAAVISAEPAATSNVVSLDAAASKDDDGWDNIDQREATIPEQIQAELFVVEQQFAKVKALMESLQKEIDDTAAKCKEKADADKIVKIRKGIFMASDLQYKALERESKSLAELSAKGQAKDVQNAELVAYQQQAKQYLCSAAEILRDVEERAPDIREQLRAITNEVFAALQRKLAAMETQLSAGPSPVVGSPAAGPVLAFSAAGANAAAAAVVVSPAAVPVAGQPAAAASVRATA